MNIYLSADLGSLDDRSFNLQRIQKISVKARDAGADLVLFGEASLHGFEAMTFDYATDIVIASGVHAPEIAAIRQHARRVGIAIGFGFFENLKGGIFSSYMVVDRHGDIADLYRRVSPGWRIPDACADYREGTSFHTFSLEGKTWAVMVCGDFWEDTLLTPLIALDPEVDGFFWPVHCDVDVDDWKAHEADAYRQRSAIMAKPVLFVNNYIDVPGRAKGGAYVWHRGQTVASHPMGTPGGCWVTL
jgi:predicted amidohydrolase